MEVRFHWFVITIVNVVVMIGYVTSDVHSLKCSDNDPRDVYDGCMLDYRDMALWCDRTNLTCVPDPKTIRSQAPCQRAVYLYMNDSCLSHIEPEMLEKYISLEVADFSKNQLTQITNYTFVSSSHIVLLDLSENRISDIEADAFVVVDNLEKVKLYKNLLSRLQPGVFKNMTKLQGIDLSSNQLDMLDWSWFASKVNLQFLNLTGNEIAFLQQPLAGQVKNLVQLDISENKLQTMKRENLVHMRKLKDLYLRRNQLVTVEEDAFEDTHDLVTVDLRDNKLQSLPNNLFKNLCYLQHLLLTGNSLITLHSDWLGNVLRYNYNNPVKMMSQPLSDNKWSCDCKMLPYWEMLQTMKNDSLLTENADIFDIECFAPEELSGNNLATLERHQLTSDEENNKTVYTKNLKQKELMQITKKTNFCILMKCKTTTKKRN